MTAPSGNSRPNRTGRQVQDITDLGVVHPHDIAEHDRCTELDGKRLQGRVEFHSVSHPTGLIGRLAPRGTIAMFGRVEDGLGTAATATQLVEAGVCGHAIAPGPKAGPTIEPAEAPHDGQQCLLTGVGGVGLVAGQPAADGEEAVVVTPEELIQRCPITEFGPLDQLFVRRMVLGSAIVLSQDRAPRSRTDGAEPDRPNPRVPG